MKLLFTTVIVVLIFILGIQNLNCQTKGSFDISVNVVNGAKPISFYVPNDYDPAKEYTLMICLHGAGQACNSYRDNLCPAWSTFIKNTIFACPEGGGPSGDFYNQSGDETIIDSAINYVKRNYSIDEKKIILQGFSLGGRSALKYGLDHPDDFQGLLLNTPAIQSNLDANNHPVYSLKYNYQNGANLPIAITHGSTDQGYYNIIDTVFKKLTDNNSRVIFNRIVDMGHKIPNQTIIQKCLDFIGQPLKNNLDADVSHVMPPERTYEQKIKPLFRMRNMGVSQVTSAEISYSINGTKANYSWTGSLNSFEHADIELPEITCAENVNTLAVKIISINGTNADATMSKKQDSIQFQCLTQSLQLPYTCGFETTDPSLNLWGVHTSGGMMSWGIYEDAKTEGVGSVMMYNTPFFNINQGLSEDLLSPLMDLTTVNNPCLAFDLSFNYIKLTTAGGYPQNFTFTDTLEILMSTDNGLNYTNIYSKTGNDLATISTPITNPTSLDACVFVPSSNQWRRDVIMLNDYSTQTKAVFVFKYISGMGGTLWLDNVRFMSYDDLVDVSDIASDSGISISPNPAYEMINLKIPENTSEIRIYNFIGLQIYKSSVDLGKTELQINANEFNSGIYLIEAVNGKNTLKEKLVIKK